MTALNRAEALYLDLAGSERDVLGSAMSELRLALELQEPQPIERAREILLNIIQALSR